MKRNIIRITDFNNPAVAVYNERSERNLLHYYEPEQGIFIAESPEVIERALTHGFEPVSFLIEEKQLAGIEAEASLVMTQMDSYPVYIADHEHMRQITGYPMTRGFLCAMRRGETPSLKQIAVNSHLL